MENHKQELPPPNPPPNRVSFAGGGMGLQDWSSLNGDGSRPPDVRDSLMSMGTEISETSSLGILPLDDMGEWC